MYRKDPFKIYVQVAQGVKSDLITVPFLTGIFREHLLYSSNSSAVDPGGLFCEQSTDAIVAAFQSCVIPTF